VPEASPELVKRSIAVLLATTRGGAGTSLLAGGILGFIFVPAAGWWPFLAWYAVFALSMVARQRYFRFVVARDGATEQTLFRIAVVSAVTGWLAAASVPLFEEYLSIADIGVLTVIMVSWVALAVGVLAVQPRVYAVYVAVFLPTVFTGWIRHASLHDLLLIGASMALGGPMMTRLAYTVHGQLRKTVEASQQNALLVEQLREALASQQEAQRARSRFLGAASHDLRQPVQALLFLSDLFRKSTDAARRDAMAQQIMRTGQSIDGMFRHLVDFAQIDAGTMKAVVQPVQLERIVGAAVSGFAEKCAARGLRFRLEMDTPGTVSADPVLLERMLRNFLDNACKYSLQGEIVLRVAAEGGQAVLSVADQGLGMENDDLAQACNAFFRGRSASRAEAEGIGLGLAICKHMADLMQAQLQLASQPGQGTCVSIRLPVVQEQPAIVPAAAAPRQEAPLDGLLVAVIENDRLAREALCAWLEDAGARVAWGGSLAQLQEALRAEGEGPDLVVADYRLAQGTGVQAIEAIRARHGAVPALIVSGEPDAVERAPGVPVLQKPVTPERLLEALRTLRPARRSVPADAQA
jgi:signal transduction histidine kinase/ActR/RegA family two-component response regulator